MNTIKNAQEKILHFKTSFVVYRHVNTDYYTYYARSRLKI